MLNTKLDTKIKYIVFYVIIKTNYAKLSCLIEDFCSDLVCLMFYYRSGGLQNI